MRELLARMRVGSLNNKIQIKTQRTNMEINSNLSRISSLQSRNPTVAKKYFNILVVRLTIYFDILKKSFSLVGMGKIFQSSQQKSFTWTFKNR